MCRIGSIKSKVPVSPAKALKLMIPQQEGHDNSGFAMVMKDLYGIFSDYKDKPLLSLACTQRGAEMVEEYKKSVMKRLYSIWMSVWTVNFRLIKEILLFAGRAHPISV